MDASTLLPETLGTLLHEDHRFLEQPDHGGGVAVREAVEDRRDRAQLHAALGINGPDADNPSRSAGPMARRREPSTDPLPEPVAPAIRRWLPRSRSRHGFPSSWRPTGSALRSGISSAGSAGTISASGSR